jgi:hypothetical protein
MKYTVPPAGTIPTTVKVEPRVMKGSSLAWAKRGAALRALDAADLYLGRARLGGLTKRQAATLARVSVTYLEYALAVAKKKVLRNDVKDGYLPLADAATKARPLTLPKSTNLIKAYAKATAEERLELGRVVGVDRVFDETIAPTLV